MLELIQGIYIGISNGWMIDLQVHGAFNSISVSVISCQWKSDCETLLAMEPHLKLKRFLLIVGYEPGPLA